MGWGQERRNFRRKGNLGRVCLTNIFILKLNWGEIPQHFSCIFFFSAYNFVMHGYITKSRLNNVKNRASPCLVMHCFPCDWQHTIICYCSVQHFGMYNIGCTAKLLKVLLRALYSWQVDTQTKQKLLNAGVIDLKCGFYGYWEPLATFYALLKYNKERMHNIYIDFNRSTMMGGEDAISFQHWESWW